MGLQDDLSFVGWYLMYFKHFQAFHRAFRSEPKRSKMVPTKVEVQKFWQGELNNHLKNVQSIPSIHSCSWCTGHQMLMQGVVHRCG